MLKKITFSLLLMLFVFTLFSQTIIVEPQTLDLKQGETAQVKVKITIPENQHCTKQEDYLYVDFDEDSGLTVTGITYPQSDKQDEFGNDVYYGEVVLNAEISSTSSLTEGSHELEMLVGYQFCNEEGTCLLPEEERIPLNINMIAGDSTDIDVMSILKFILLAFIGGIILNVMPCVLPVLSIKALSIVKQSHQDKKDIFKHSLAYTFGILLSFLILSTIVILIKLSGELVGWGFQFQNPTFVIVLYSVMFVFALSMFDVLIFQAPGMNVAYQASGKTGFSGSFLSGIFAVILATPCTAPFLGTALGFAFSQPPFIILAIFLAIGLGLAMPFLMIGIFPSSIKILPKPGNWMNIFKEAMGFLLLATSVWLLNVVYTQLGGSNLIRVLFFTVVLALASWLYGTFVKPQYSKAKQWVMTIIAVLVVVFGAYFLLQFKEADSVNSAEAAHADGLWKTFSEEAVYALIDEGKPVFVDFSAEWCMTCKTNETTVLWTKEIEDAFVNKGVTLFAGDYTRKDPTIHAWLKKFNKAGVPLYLLYIPGQNEPIVFPELITKGMVLDKLSLIPESIIEGEN